MFRIGNVLVMCATFMATSIMRHQLLRMTCQILGRLEVSKQKSNIFARAMSKQSYSYEGLVIFIRSPRTTKEAILARIITRSTPKFLPIPKQSPKYQTKSLNMRLFINYDTKTKKPHSQIVLLSGFSIINQSNPRHSRLVRVNDLTKLIGRGRIELDGSDQSIA